MKKINDIEYAIFDMDGTLVDSMWAWDTAADRMLKEMKITPKPEMREDIRPMTTAEVAYYMQEHYGLHLTPAELIDLFNRTMEGFYQNEAELKEGVPEFLEKLKQKKVGMCIATATDRYMAENALRRLGILHYFDFIITCTEVGKAKGDPLIFNKCIERSGSRREKTWVFEDSDFAIMTAKKAGYPVLGIYDRSSECFEESKKKNSDIYILSFNEVTV